MWCDRSDLDARFCAHCRREELGADVPLELDDLSAPRAELKSQALGRNVEPSQARPPDLPSPLRGVRPPTYTSTTSSSTTSGTATAVGAVDDGPHPQRMGDRALLKRQAGAP